MLRARERGPIDSPRGLLFATARNVARDLFRRRAAVRTFSVAEIDVSRVLDNAPGVADAVSRAHEADLLRAAINDLPERCREILVLRKFDNLSHREIAARLGIAEHTVEAQLTKALHRCEKFFAKKARFSEAGHESARLTSARGLSRDRRCDPRGGGALDRAARSRALGDRVHRV